MKNTNKLLSFSKLWILLSVFTVGVIFFGCSDDEENVSNPYEYSAEQKAQILALAEKYGLKVELEDEYSGEVLPTIQEIEKYFQFMSKVISQKYQLCLVKEGEVAVMPSPLFTRSTSASEGGSWHERASACNRNFDFSIKWKSVGGKVTATLKPSFDEFGVNIEMSGFQYTWVGDGGLGFYFDAKITYSSFPSTRNLRGSGQVSTKSGMGYLNLMVL